MRFYHTQTRPVVMHSCYCYIVQNTTQMHTHRKYNNNIHIYDHGIILRRIKANIKEITV